MKDIKNHFILLFFSLFISIVSCDSKKQFVSLSLVKPTVIKKNGNEIFQYWQLSNSSLLWDTTFITPRNITRYRDSLNSILTSDTTRSIIQKRAEQYRLYKLVNTQNGDSINTQLIHANVLGEIRPINYLEAQLLEYQMNRYPLLSHPTEFHGFILLNDSLNIVRVYFAASDQPWPPKPNVILSAIKNDLKTGWTFKYHLHNHYEPHTNGYIGILAPSMTDAQYYLFLSDEYQLKNAIITNGFHTVEIPSGDFQKLKTP